MWASYQLRPPGLRSRDWLKVKIDREVDALIVGAEEGEGRLKGSLGALVVKDESGKKFKIGTGFSDAERHRLWLEFRDGAQHGEAGRG